MKFVAGTTTGLALGSCLPKDSSPTISSSPFPLEPKLPTKTPVKPIEVTPSQTPEPQATEALLPTATEERSIVLPIPVDAQDFNLSCEASAAGMVAAYIQPDVPKGYLTWEEYFIDAVPKNCNPHRGFRGPITGFLSTTCYSDSLGYGVYAEPIEEAFRKTGIPAKAEYNVDYGWVEMQIKNRHPVIVWISRRDKPPRYATDPETGQEYVLLFGEHVWVVAGVDRTQAVRRFLVNDPGYGTQSWVTEFPRWDTFDNMSLAGG